MYLQVEVSASNRSLVQSSPTERGESECDREASSMGSNPAVGQGCLSNVYDVYCHVEVSASDRSLVQRGLKVCGVSECDPEGLIMRWP